MELPHKMYSSSKDALDAMYQAVLAAKKSIYWEVYIFVDDEVGKPFFQALIDRAKNGVDVKIIVDSLGSSDLSDGQVRELRSAGVDIRFFQERKNKYRGWWKRLWARTHRKILVVDEMVGFIGGVNVQKEVSTWLDIQFRFTGKIVHSLLRAFAKSYIVCGGEKSAVRHLLKYNFRLLHDRAEFIFDEPSEKRSVSRHHYSDALLKARERAIFFSPYYFPDKKFLLALWRARKRGIKVDLLLPLRSDIRLMTYASYAWFGLMNKLGVKIYLTDQMMHGKGVIVDDDWAVVGSANLNYTSFYDNYEAGVHLKDKVAVKKLKNKILSWMKNTAALDVAVWEKRGWVQRLKEKLAKFLYNLWNGNK